jgi:hypothetical protein
MLTFHIDGKQTEVAEVTPTLATGTTQKLIFYYIISPIRNTIHKELIQM